MSKYKKNITMFILTFVMIVSLFFGLMPIISNTASAAVSPENCDHNLVTVTNLNHGGVTATSGSNTGWVATTSPDGNLAYQLNRYYNGTNGTCEITLDLGNNPREQVLPVSWLRNNDWVQYGSYQIYGTLDSTRVFYYDARSSGLGFSGWRTEYVTVPAGHHTFTFTLIKSAKPTSVTAWSGGNHHIFEIPHLSAFDGGVCSVCGYACPHNDFVENFDTESHWLTCQDEDGCGIEILGSRTPHTFDANGICTGCDYAELHVFNGSYIITNPQQLLSFSKLVENHYTNINAILANDINMKGVDFTPIGSEQFPFEGIFNGNYHRISNLNVNMPDKDYVGFFGAVRGHTVAYLLIDNTCSFIGKNHVAPFGCGAGLGTITFVNVGSEATVSGQSDVYGFTQNEGASGGEYINCYVASTIRSKQSSVSGFTCHLAWSTVESCYFAGEIYVNGKKLPNTAPSTSGNITMYNTYGYYESDTNKNYVKSHTFAAGDAKLTNGTLLKDLGSAYKQGATHPVLFPEPQNVGADHVHDYFVTYEWLFDGAECRATAVCKDVMCDGEGSYVTETVTANIEQTGTLAGTNKIINTHTAEFTNSIFSTQQRQFYSVADMYYVTVNKIGNGVLSVDKNSALKDTVITITVYPNDGYAFNTSNLVATYGDNQKLTLTKVNDTTWTFVMPEDNVNVSVKFGKMLDSSNIAKLAPVDYTGSAITPEVVVKDGDKTLELGKDYTVAYSNNVTAGLATATVTYIGDYAGTGNAYFTINKVDPTITSEPTAKEELVYDGTAQELVNVGTVEGGVIAYSTSQYGTYSLTAPKQTNAGTYTVWYKVVGDGNHNHIDAQSIMVTIHKADNVTELSVNSVVYGNEVNVSYRNSANAGAVTISYKAVDADDSEYTTEKPTQAGWYTVKMEVAADQNYKKQIVTKNFEIIKPELTVTVSSVSLNKGDEFSADAITVSYDGFVNGEDESVLNGNLVIDTSSVSTATAGVYALTASGLTSNNYNIVYVDGYAKVYDYADRKLEFTITTDGKDLLNVQAGDEFTVVYQVTKNTGIDALELMLSYDKDVFDLISISTNDTTVLGVASKTFGLGDKVVFDNALGNGTAGCYTSYGKESDKLITATFKVKTTVIDPGTYEFTFANLNDLEGDSNAWIIDPALNNDQTSSHLPVEITVVSLEVIIKAEAQVFFVNDYQRAYNGESIAATEVALLGTEGLSIAWSYTNVENFPVPTVSFKWYDVNGVEVTDAIKNVGVYKIIASVAGDDYWTAREFTIADLTATGTLKVCATYTITPAELIISFAERTEAYKTFSNDTFVAYLSEEGYMTIATLYGDDTITVALDATSILNANVGTYDYILNGTNGVLVSVTDNANYVLVGVEGVFNIDYYYIDLSTEVYFADDSYQYDGSMKKIYADDNKQIDGTAVTVVEIPEEFANILTVSGYVNLSHVNHTNCEYGCDGANGAIGVGVYEIQATYVIGASYTANYKFLNDVNTKTATLSIVILAISEEDVNAAIEYFVHDYAKATNPVKTLTVDDNTYTVTYDAFGKYIYVNIASGYGISAVVSYQMTGMSIAANIDTMTETYADFTVENAGEYIVNIVLQPEVGYVFGENVSHTFQGKIIINKANLKIVADAEDIAYGTEEDKVVFTSTSEGWVAEENFDTDKYNTSEEEILSYVRHTYKKGMDAGSHFYLYWVNGAKVDIEDILFNYNVTLTTTNGDILLDEEGNPVKPNPDYPDPDNPPYIPNPDYDPENPDPDVPPFIPNPDFPGDPENPGDPWIPNPDYDPENPDPDQPPYIPNPDIPPYIPVEPGDDTPVVEKAEVDVLKLYFDGFEKDYTGEKYEVAVTGDASVLEKVDWTVVELTKVDGKYTIVNVVDSGDYTANVVLKAEYVKNYKLVLNGDYWTFVDDMAVRTDTFVINHVELTIVIDYTKTTATFTLEGFVGDETVEVLENLAYTVNASTEGVNGNVYTIFEKTATGYEVVANSTNENYYITSNTLRAIYQVTFESNEPEVATEAAVGMPDPSTFIMFGGFAIERPATDPTLKDFDFEEWIDNIEDPEHYDFDALVTADIIIYAHWGKGELVILRYVVITNDNVSLGNEGFFGHKYGEQEIFASDTITLHVFVNDVIWFNGDNWYYGFKNGKLTDGKAHANYAELKSKAVEEIVGGETVKVVTLYAKYIFDIGLGDVNADHDVNLNDVLLYRQKLVGGYAMIEIANGDEWKYATGDEATLAKYDDVAYDAENTYFLDRVADTNAKSVSSTTLGDTNMDIRDVSTIRMALVGGYNLDIETNLNVSGDEVVISKELSDVKLIERAIKHQGAVTLDESVSGEEDIIATHLAKNVTINLNGKVLSVGMFHLEVAGNYTITITNGTINAMNGIIIKAPEGNVVLQNVTTYDVNGNIELQAASESLHLKGNVNFYKGTAENAVPAEVTIPVTTHIVLEDNANVVLENIKVTVPEFFMGEKKLSIKAESVAENANVISVVSASEEAIEVEVKDANGEDVVDLVEEKIFALTINGATTYYATLAEAMDNIQAGNEAIVTLKNSIEDNLVFIAKTLTLNLGGNTVNGYISVSNGAKVTIYGGNVENNSACGIYVTNGAEIVIDNVNVTAQEVCVLVYSNSKATINGGTYTSNDNFVVGTNGTNGWGNNTIIINGGTFNGNIQSTGYIACGIYLANSDTLVVNGGTFNVKNGVGILVRSGNATIGKNVVFNVTSDGTITAGKVGDSKVNIEIPKDIVIDKKSGYPGGDPSVNVEDNAFVVYDNSIN